MTDAPADVLPSTALSVAAADAALGAWDASVRTGGEEPALASVARQIVGELSGAPVSEQPDIPAGLRPARAVHELTTLRAAIVAARPDAAAVAGTVVDRWLADLVTRTTAELQQGFDEASRDRHKLLSVVAHDLKNPLNTILLSIAVLDGTASALPDTVRRTLATVARASRRMNKLIDDLLDLRSINTGRLLLEPAPRDPLALVHAAVASGGTDAADKGLSLEIEAQAGLPKVRADQVRVQQALSNILANAVKATPRGSIVVGVKAGAADEIVFWIADTGPGIEPDHRQLVFEPYWRAPTVSYTGTGLGLAVTRGIVEAHGGRIWIEEHEGGGTRVLFTLPVDR